MADTTSIEKKSLEAHVELCAERYRALDMQLENVRQDITDVKGMVKETHDLVHSLANKRNDQLLRWGAGVIGVLSALVAWFFTHFIFG